MHFSTMCALVLLAVFSVSAHNTKIHHKQRKHHNEHAHCFSETELETMPSNVLDKFVGHKMRWDNYLAVTMVPKLEDIERRRKRRKREPQTSCPKYDSLKTGQSVNERSISPWSYRINVDETRYPEKLAFAHCLCNHCISVHSGKETSSLNSVEIKQTMLVLRKKTCPHDPSLSTFHLEYLVVPVACTCSVPRYDDDHSG